MQIVDAKLYSTFGGSTKLALLVGEEPPDRSEFRFENQGDYWYAEKDGYVEYFIEGAKSGVNRTVTTVDGEERTFRGVGAGRASVFNREGIGPFVDVKLTDDETYFERGPGNMYKASVTLEAAREASELAGAEMEKEEDEEGEITWVPKPID